MTPLGSKTVWIALSENDREYTLDNQMIDKKHVIGISTRRKGSGAKPMNGKTLVSDAVFDAGYINIKKNQKDIFNNLPLSFLDKEKNELGYFPIDLKRPDLTNSELRIAYNVTITTGEVIEITYFYI